MRTDTETLAAAMDIIARDIESGDGVAKAAISEAAHRLRDQRDALERLAHLYELENEPCERPSWLSVLLDSPA